MFWAILGGGAVVAAILLWFLWTLLGWVGLTFGIIAVIGVAGVSWYAYVLYGKATDLWNQLEVLGKRVGSLGTLLAEIKLPEEKAGTALPAQRAAGQVPVPTSSGPGRRRERTADPDLDDEDEFFLA